MKTRADIVHENFCHKVTSNLLPENLYPDLTPKEVGLTTEELIDLFETQMISRWLDFAARELKKENLTYYTIGSSGHEGNACLGLSTEIGDMAFLHYRSGSFFIQRSKKLHGSTPIYDIGLSLAASSDDPISGGRHKVFGSKILNIPPQTSTIASHLPKALGTALSIRRAKDLNLESRHLDNNSIVLVSFGDASYNHASAQAAINSACLCAYQNIPVPLIFVCEDNGIGISVPTPKNWIAHSAQGKTDLKYIFADGRHLLHAYQGAKKASDYTRKSRRPTFFHLKTVRLLGHAGSDIESLYHSTKHIENAEAQDPLLHSARIMVDQGILSARQILEIYHRTGERVLRVCKEATNRPKLDTAAKVASSIVATSPLREAVQKPTPDSRNELFKKDVKYLDKPQHMAKLLNWGLSDVLLEYKNAVIFGEDVAKKGGVYHITTGLLDKFGPRRVFNSPLDETSILGTAIGLAHNGFIPIPEIQFLAYVHNAEDQIRGEAATLSFFSNGQFQNGMVIRVAGLAYQKGFGGHFHNDNSLAVFRDIPGILMACPSNGVDAVKMFRTCMQQAHSYGRVCIFIEPIALYMKKDLHSEGDNLWSGVYPDTQDQIAVGEIGVHGSGKDLAVVTYGNGVSLSLEAIKNAGVKASVFDLRWLTPINHDALANKLKVFNKILVVDECRKTGSPSEEIITGLCERLSPLPQIQRLAADDCFIPLGVGATIVLPRAETIEKAILDLLNTESAAGSKPKAKVKSKAKKKTKTA